MSGGIAQNKYGDMLSQSEQSESADQSVMLERIVTALTRGPINLYEPWVINWYGKGQPAIIINVDADAKAQGVQVIRKNGEQATLGVGLEGSGIVANYLHQREPFRVNGDTAALKGRRARTNEADPGTGFGETGFGTGKPADDQGSDSARPGELYENDFNNQYLRQNTGVFMAEGVLTTDLAAASDGKTGATTAMMTMWVRDESSETDPIELIDGDEITVVNRDTTLSLPSGRYLQVLKIQGEWRPYWAACSAS